MDKSSESPAIEVKTADENKMDTDVTVTNHVDGKQETSLDTSELETAETANDSQSPAKKARSSGRKRRSNVDMFEEAKATCGGEIDMSEGRRLRKRPDPPKVEKTPPTRKPHQRKSKTPTNKDVDDGADDTSQADNKDTEEKPSDNNVKKNDDIVDSKPEHKSTEENGDEETAEKNSTSDDVVVNGDAVPSNDQQPAAVTTEPEKVMETTTKATSDAELKSDADTAAEVVNNSN